MTDIVAKLKSPATIFYEYVADEGGLLYEAADTIEALRAENARLLEALKPFADLYNPEENVYLDMRLDAGFNPGIVVPMKYLRAARAAMGEKE